MRGFLCFSLLVVSSLVAAQVSRTIPVEVNTALANAGGVVGLIGAAVLLIIVSIAMFKAFQAVVY